MLNRPIAIAIIAVISLLSTTLYADITESVVVVRPKLGEPAIEAYQNIAFWMEGIDEDEVAEFFNSFIDSGFGSGVLMAGPDDTVIVVTNYHVVAQALSADVEFKGRQAAGDVAEDCPVIASDPDRDLAIILLKDYTIEEVTVLALSERELLDGDEVHSAGYPGLNGTPSWQFSKGTVTNQTAYIQDLQVPKIEYVIQHSALIDPGSSGGPLLIRNTEDENRWDVAGINTWSVNDRDSTYFAIPTFEVQDYLGMVYQSVDGDQDAILEEACKNFSELLTDDLSDPRTINYGARLLSTDLVADHGWSAYLEYLAHLEELDRSDKKERKELDNFDSELLFRNPFEAMGAAMFRPYWGQAESEEVTWETLEKEENRNDRVTVFHDGQNDIEITWTLEGMRWVINFFGNINMSYVDAESPNEELFAKLAAESEIENREIARQESSEKEKKQNLKGLGITFRAGAAFPLLYDYSNASIDGYTSSKIGFSTEIGLDYLIFPFLGVNLGIGYQHLAYSLEYQDSGTYEYQSVNQAYNLLTPVLTLRLQVAKFGKKGNTTIFYFAGGVGFSFILSSPIGTTTESPAICIPLRAGIEFGPKYNKNHFFWFIEGQWDFITSFDSTNYLTDDYWGDPVEWNISVSQLIINLGIRYKF